MRHWLLVSWLLCASSAWAETPELLSVGADGGGRLSDWSTSGAQSGAAFPTGRTPTHVFGPGEHLLTSQVTFQSNDFWRCEPGSMLRIPKPLSEVAGVGPGGGNNGWTWDGGYLKLQDVQNVLIGEPGKPCILDFDATKYQSHHTGEKGYNGFDLANASHCWLHLDVRDADSGGFFRLGSHHNTVVLALSHPTRTTYYTDGKKGHYGVKLAASSHHNHVTVDMQTKFFHDVSVAGNANLNVVTGRGLDVNFDHHRSNTPAHHNLITDFDCGLCTRPFDSSGPYTDGYTQSGPWEVFWGLHKADGGLVSKLPQFGSAYFSRQVVIVQHTNDKQTATAEWLESLAYATLTPKNLYLHQRGESPSTPPTPSLREQVKAKLMSGEPMTDAQAEYLLP
jgi:hypothetical protein